MLEEYKEEKRIGKSGGAAALYIPKEARRYIAPGDVVQVETVVTGNEVRITASKRVYNFSLDDIRQLTRDEFRVEYDKNLGEVLVFEAIKDQTHLSYTQSLREKLAPGYVTIARTFQTPTVDEYKRINGYATKLQRRFDVLVRPEGDLDAINLLKDPKHYHLTSKEEAISLLRKSGKEIGLSVVARFDNTRNKLEDVRSALQELTSLDSKLRS